MQWQIITHASSDGDPVLRYYEHQLAEKIREYFSQIDRVQVLWRRAGEWLPAPIGIGISSDKKEREQMSPEEGAKQICDLAFKFATENDARYLRFEGYGSSTTGDSIKRLFRVNCRPFETPDEEKKDAVGNAAIEACNVLNETVQKVGNQLDKAFTRENTMAEQCREMGKVQNENVQHSVMGLRIAQEMKREYYDHLEKMDDLKYGHETTEKLVETFGEPLGKAAASGLEDFISQAFNIDKKAWKAGTFAERLTAIIKSVPEDDAKKAKELLGDEAWGVLKKMSKVPDDEFKAIGAKFKELLGDDPGKKFKEFAAILGGGRSLALMQLLIDADLAE